MTGYVAMLIYAAYVLHFNGGDRSTLTHVHVVVFASGLVIDQTVRGGKFRFRNYEEEEVLRIAGAGATGGMPYAGMDVVERVADRMRYEREREEAENAKDRDRKSSSSIQKEENDGAIESVAV